MPPRLQQFCDISKFLVHFLLFKLFTTPFSYSWKCVFLLLGRLINDTQWQSQFKSDSSSPLPHSFALLSNATCKKSRVELILLTAHPRQSIKENWFNFFSLNSCCPLATFIYHASGSLLPGKKVMLIPTKPKSLIWLSFIYQNKQNLPFNPEYQSKEGLKILRF